MPFPTYHVGVNSFFGLALRRWVDPFVIVASNVIIDLEVLFAPGFPEYHRHWHFHTFLEGGVIGAAFGVVCWLFSGVISRAMKLVRIPYEPKLWKMCLAGTLGFWLHVLMDSFWHWDVQPLRPFTSRNDFWRLFKHTYPNDQVHRWIIVISVILSVAAVVLYILAVLEFNKSRKCKEEPPKSEALNSKS